VLFAVLLTLNLRDYIFCKITDYTENVDDLKMIFDSV